MTYMVSNDMYLSQKEQNLILRSRSKGYKIIRFLVMFFAVIGISLTTILTVMVYSNLEDRDQYQEQLAQLSNLPEQDSLPIQFISATKYESITEAVEDYTRAYILLLDSLKLSDKVTGAVFHLDISPTGVEGWRYGISQMDVFTSCGCDQEGFSALHTLEVNPITMSASVVSSQEILKLADYRTLQRYSLSN